MAATIVLGITIPLAFQCSTISAVSSHSEMETTEPRPFPSPTHSNSSPEFEYVCRFKHSGLTHTHTFLQFLLGSIPIVVAFGTDSLSEEFSLHLHFPCASLPVEDLAAEHAVPPPVSSPPAELSLAFLAHCCIWRVYWQQEHTRALQPPCRHQLLRHSCKLSN